MPRPWRRCIPALERMMSASRPDCERLKNSAFRFIGEICGPARADLWVDYRFYVRTLSADP